MRRFGHDETVARSYIFKRFGAIPLEYFVHRRSPIETLGPWKRVDAHAPKNLVWCATE